jgi:hypothetical protein
MVVGGFSKYTFTLTNSEAIGYDYLNAFGSG